MSHRIIITRRATAIVEHDDPAVEYEITFTPPHDMSPEQVGDKVARILKLAEKMQE